MNINNSNFASIDEMRHKINAAEQKTNQTALKTGEKSTTFGEVLQSTADRVRFPNMRQDAWRQEIFL